MYELLDKIRQKPGLYIGHESPTHLDAFLSGYWLGNREAGKGDSPEFGAFHDWVAARLGYSESTSGWAYMIEDQRRDQKEGLWLFFDLLDEFRGIRHVELAAVNYTSNFSLDTSWRGYCRRKKIRGTFKAIAKPRPVRLLLKQIVLSEKWYSLVAVNDKEEVLDVRSAGDLESLLKRAEEVYGVGPEYWK